MEYGGLPTFVLARALRAGVVAAVLFLALAPAARADWPLYGHDLGNSRSSGSDGPTTTQAQSLKPAWTFGSSNGDFTGTPVVAGGVLVAGTNMGTVYAIDAVTGRQLWSVNVGAPINGSAAVDTRAPGGPLAIVPIASEGEPRLIGLSLADGRTRWQTSLTRQQGSDVFGSPTYWNGSVYIGTSGPNTDEATARGSVVALDEATGKMRWQTYTVPPGHDGGAVWSTPAVDTATGRLYVGTGNAYHAPAADTTDSMMALDASSGAILGHFQSTAGDVWEANAPLGGPDYDFGASPNLIAASNGRAMVGEGSKSGTYWALDRSTMQPVWNTMVGPGATIGGILASTAYDGSRIYGNDSIDSQVWALGPDGFSQWNSVDGSAPDWSPVAVSNGVLYSSDDGMLIARNASSGAVLTRASLGGPSFGGISVVGGAVYAAVGTGPPPQPAPQTDGAGSIVAFGDTSRSGAPSH